MNRKERDFVKRLPLMNYTGKIKTTENNVCGMHICKVVTKECNGKVETYNIGYKIRSHQITLPFDDYDDIDEILLRGKLIAKQILNEEIEELVESYININIKDIEINAMYDKWVALQESNGSLYKDADGNVILVKYYRLAPTAKFLSINHSFEELKLMSEKEDLN